MINALIIWFIIVITHGLTRAYATRPIIQQMVNKVHYVDRTPNIQAFTEEFILGEHCPDDPEMLRRSMIQSIEGIINQLPSEFIHVRCVERYDLRPMWGMQWSKQPTTPQFPKHYKIKILLVRPDDRID